MGKTRRITAVALVALTGLLAGPAAHAGVIINNAIAGTVTNTFDGLPEGNVAGFISQTGATYGERLAGQILSTAGGFDALAGAPTAPLTLVANPTLSDNIGILTFAPGKIVYGDLAGTVGEGALTILLGLDTTVFGFDVVGTDGGSFTTQFFGRSGALLGSITQAASDGFFGFAATAGDVIAAVSITNTDPAGVGYDNVTFNQVDAISEPGLLGLFALGLVSLGIGRRRTA
jgi:hypothetical protein